MLGLIVAVGNGVSGESRDKIVRGGAEMILELPPNLVVQTLLWPTPLQYPLLMGLNIPYVKHGYIYIYLTLMYMSVYTVISRV